MNEEEKQAVKNFEDLLKKHFEETSVTSGNFLEGTEGILILNIIEKQQKEIEDLKKEKSILIEKYTDVVYECGKRNEEIEKLKSKKYILNAETNEIKEIPISDDYINKDKIRKKIDLIDKEYAETIEKNKNDLYLVNINAHRHSAMQSILEELLGE